MPCHAIPKPRVCPQESVAWSNHSSRLTCVTTAYIYLSDGIKSDMGITSLYETEK